MKNPDDLEKKLKSHFKSASLNKKASPCLDAEWIGGYAEGRLTGIEQKKVERHISNCDSCLEEFIFLKELISSEKRQNEENMPEHLNFTLEDIIKFPEGQCSFKKISINCFKCGKEILEGEEICPGCGLKLTICKEEAQLKEEIYEWLPDFLKENSWIAGAAVVFAASLALPSALFQFLLAAGLVGGMWIFEKNKQKFLEEIRDALEKGDRKKAEELVKNLKKEIS